MASLAGNHTWKSFIIAPAPFTAPYVLKVFLSYLYLEGKMEQERSFAVNHSVYRIKGNLHTELSLITLILGKGKCMNTGKLMSLDLC